MKEFMPLVFTILVIVLVSGVSVWLSETMADAQDESSDDLTGMVYRPKPPCKAVGGSCYGAKGTCPRGTTLQRGTNCPVCCVRRAASPTPALQPSPPPTSTPSPPTPTPSIQPPVATPAPTPRPSTVTPTPVPTPPQRPSCAQVTNGRGTCMSRYCDTGRNSLDVVYASGYCPGAREVCCAKNELSTLPDTQLTCAQARAKYNAENEWCQQQAPCRGRTVPTLPRYIGRTRDCAVCCIETARTR